MFECIDRFLGKLEKRLSSMENISFLVVDILIDANSEVLHDSPKSNTAFWGTKYRRFGEGCFTST